MWSILLKRLWLETELTWKLSLVKWRRFENESVSARVINDFTNKSNEARVSLSRIIGHGACITSDVTLYDYTVWKQRNFAEKLLICIAWSWGKCKFIDLSLLLQDDVKTATAANPSTINTNLLILNIFIFKNFGWRKRMEKPRFRVWIDY